MSRLAHRSFPARLINAILKYARLILGFVTCLDGC